ncbi:hypothetical protein [Aureibacter tunicatorum]|uniref:Lipoprotein n=1 Tax=Aureibacter tunicatorum TaxID=866807 RepID=A0AAE3XRU2_9BACT|nr:hypothetical protein [Aureibacter tunicatorum]MDR6240304.1 hypothetical protein [Aureibacter tunicatorum]BDD05815.1 hypothetical protein AUTU_32980 [Aureibacter tunicatorum]
MKYQTLIFTGLLFFACQSKPSDTIQFSVDSHRREVKDKLEASIQNHSHDEYMGNSLRPIREIVNRLSSLSQWTQIDSAVLLIADESVEVEYYYLDKELVKVIANTNEEKYKYYYLLNSELIFVLESEETGGDNIKEESYFEKGNLLRQVNNQDCGAPYPQDYLREEQLRIGMKFNRLIGKL